MKPENPKPNVPCGASPVVTIRSTDDGPPPNPIHRHCIISLYENERKRSGLINSRRQLLPPWKLSTETAPPKPATCLLLVVRLYLDSERGGSRREEATTVGRRAAHETTDSGCMAANDDFWQL
ncbi:hypothetical protein LXL04_023644 [Taraxacum kok-saghyz]